MSERPVLPTHITQHTVWQALSGRLPPLSLPAQPVTPAVIDSRDVEPGALFVALAGQHTNGHVYLEQAVAGGAGVVLSEPRGLEALARTHALILDCTTGGRLDTEALTGFTPNRTLAYLVDDTVEALQRIGGFQRIHRARLDLRVVGVTGSVGKTSTKELAASVLGQRFATHRNLGNLNSEQGVPLTLMGLSPEHEAAVLELAMYQVGEIRALCRLTRPQVGVVTNVGPSHLERLGSIERIVQAKAELVESLPPEARGGVAVLNWDDERVRGMAGRTQARVFRYGLTPQADLWADEIESAGLEGIRFRFHHRQEDGRIYSLYMRAPLLGRHSVHTALAAAAVGLVEGLTWPEIATGIQKTTGQLRLVVAPGVNGSTIIDDTYNASPVSTLAALNLLDDLRNGGRRRRVAVLGDMRELGSFTQEGHRQVGIRAVDATDVLVTVGELGRIIGEEALAAGYDPANVHILPDAPAAIERLRALVQAKDMVLVKGSRAVGMDAIVAAMSRD